MASNVACELAEAGAPLENDPDRLLVPEPAVKRALAGLGVDVPRSVVVGDASALPDAVEALRAPFVLKGFGPGIVHKSDVGAVRLGITAGDLGDAIVAMGRTLDGHGLQPSGYLVEEQHPGGLELIVGIVRRPPFGPVATLGLGGTLVEALDLVVARLCPLSPADAREMLGAWPGAAMFRGDGPRSISTHALLSLLLAIAGRGGLADVLGASLSELECNPVVVAPDGATALDARLILHRDPPVPRTAQKPTDFARLFAPRAIAVAGASTSKVTFGNRFLAAYRDAGWSDDLYAVHPSAPAIDDVPAVPAVSDIAGGVDYLLVALPAAQCPEFVASTAGSAKFVHVVASGFGETGEAGTRLEADLVDAARRARVRVLGPNCLGVYCPRGRQTFQLGAPMEPGSVGVLSQSGGLAGDIVKAGERRGIRFSKLVTVGNAVDVGTGELLEYLVGDPETAVIGLYLEGARDGERLVDAMRAARGRKPVVVLVAGVSVQGATAAASHTGALTGDRRVWDAIAASTGASVVETLEDLLAVLSVLQAHAHREVPGDPSVLVVGPGGGASVLATDACDRHGLAVTPVIPEARDALRAHGYGAGTSVANPLEVPLGPASKPEVLTRAVDTVLGAQRYSDLLLHVNVQSYFSYGTGGGAGLLEVVAAVNEAGWPARTAVVLRNLDCAPAADAAALLDAGAEARLPLLRSFDEAARALAAVQRFAADRGGAQA